MNDFLPNEYEVPAKSGNYMKFEDGENRFRILSSPILGWEYWVDTEDGGRKPLRKRMETPFSTVEVDEPEKIKHFWAMSVYNYKEKKVQILEITQKSIQKILRALAKDEDWGSPKEYDIVITKTGEKLDTEYQVTPKPAKKMDAGIIKAYEDMHIKLEALYDGADPFAGEDIDVDPADVERSEGNAHTKAF